MEEQRLVAVLSLQKQALESTRKCPFACSFSDLQHTPIDMFLFKVIARSAVEVGLKQYQLFQRCKTQSFVPKYVDCL